MPTIRDALRYGRRHLPPLEARLLLQAAMQVPPTHLIAHDEELVPPEQWMTYQINVARVANGTPLPHIVGHAPFYGRDFHVSPQVLIPRPETEQLVELALEFWRKHPGRFVDVGTGSGIIGITAALESGRPTIATDISTTALTIARQNAQEMNAPVRFVQADLLTAFSGSFTVIAANLPYITAHEYRQLPDSVRLHEPAVALRGGRDGLRLIRRLLDQAAAGRLATPGVCLLEIGWQQGVNARHLARAIFPHADVSLLSDLAGNDRLIRIEQT